MLNRQAGKKKAMTSKINNTKISQTNQNKIINKMVLTCKKIIIVVAIIILKSISRHNNIIIIMEGCVQLETLHAHVQLSLTAPEL